MKKNKGITIKTYRGNIIVLVTDIDGYTSESFGIDCSPDDFPSKSYMPSIRDLYNKYSDVITLDQARQIKHCLIRVRGF